MIQTIVVQNLLTFASSFVFAVLGLALGSRSNLPEVWPLAGLALFLLCRYRPRILPGIAAALLCAYVAHGYHPLLAAGTTLANIVALMAASAILCKRFQFQGNFEQPRETTVFLFFGVLVESVTAATLVVGSHVLARSIPWEGVLDGWFTVWVGHAMGGLFVAPVLFTWQGRCRGVFRKSPSQWLELALLSFGLWVSLYLVLYADTAHDFSQGAFQLLPIPFVIWAALRMGPQGTSMVLLITAVLCIHAALSESGPFQTSPAGHELACVLGFLAYLMLFMSSKIRQLERTTEALRVAEGAANDLRGRYQNLVENVSDVIYRMDPDGTVTYVSPAATAISGYLPEELVGRPYGNIVHPDDIVRMWGNFQSALAGEQTADTFRAIAKDGRIRHVHASSRAEFQDGKAVAVLGVINDRTEIVEMMQALEASRETYRTLVENISDVIFQIAPDGSITYLSPVAESVLGFSVEALRDMEFGERVHPDDREKSRDHFQRTLAGESLSHEVRVIDISGNVLHVRSSIRPLVRDGKTVGVTGILSNISSLRAAETALRQREALLTAAFDNVPFDFWACDGEGRYVIQNPTSRYHWGDCIGKHPGEIPGLDIDMVTQWIENNAMAMSGELVQHEFSIFRDGMRRYFQKIIAPIRDGNYVIGTLGVNIDITEQRNSEEAYARLVESSPQGLAIIQDACFVFVNAALLEMLHYSSDALLALPAGEWLNVLHPDNSARLRAVHARMLETPERPAPGTPPVEIEGVRADGVSRWFQVYCTPLVYRGRAAVQAVYVDITQQKEAEKSRKLLESQMQHTQKLESLGVLAGGIAHDFNNLLTGILGNAELLRMDLEPDSERMDSVDQIAMTARRAAELCQQMLAYAGRAQFTVADVSLNELIEEMTDLLRVSISKKARIEMSLDPNVSLVHADASQIRQVALNLITNASEALGDEEGVISIRTGLMTFQEIQIRETYLEEDLPDVAYCYLEVCDTGAGMDHETRRRLFEPFFTTKFTGRGLGLAAVLGIVRAHKGLILVESEPGEGSCFRMVLPMAADRKPARAPARADESLKRLAGVVLVVDDEPTVRQTADRALRRLGLEVLLAEDGVEGLATFEAHRDTIRLILLDVTMPRLGGDEVLKTLRAGGSSVPVILMSGYTAEDMSTRFDEEDAADFLQKPFAFNEFNSLVRRVLAGDDT